MGVDDRRERQAGLYGNALTETPDRRRSHPGATAFLPGAVAR